MNLNVKIKPIFFDGQKPIDISIPLTDKKNLNAWNAPPVSITPVDKKLTTIRFNKIEFIPHSHCTHTECLGHITPEFYSVEKSLKNHFFLAKLISVRPKKIHNDKVITQKCVQSELKNDTVQALIVRTLPNPSKKKTLDYSQTNPPYFAPSAAKFIREQNILHWLVDLPSVDKENDNGAVAAHHNFWGLPQNPRKNATITELIFVPSKIPDGMYLLNLQTAPMINDAAASRPVLFAEMKKN